MTWENADAIQHPILQSSHRETLRWGNKHVKTVADTVFSLQQSLHHREHSNACQACTV
jgi:hypothetical protein